MGNPKLFPFFINAIKAVALSMTPNKDSTVFTSSITLENLKILTIPVYLILNMANLKHLEKKLLDCIKRVTLVCAECVKDFSFEV